MSCHHDFTIGLFLAVTRGAATRVREQVKQYRTAIKRMVGCGVALAGLAQPAHALITVSASDMGGPIGACSSTDGGVGIINETCNNPNFTNINVVAVGSPLVDPPGLFTTTMATTSAASTTPNTLTIDVTQTGLSFPGGSLSVNLTVNHLAGPGTPVTLTAFGPGGVVFSQIFTAPGQAISAAIPVGALTRDEVRYVLTFSGPNQSINAGISITDEGLGPTALAGYNAIPIQADPALSNGAAITTNANGALLFDGGAGHYQAVTGQVLGDVRYTNLTTGPTFSLGVLTLLTLDVRSNRPNNPTFVDLDFFGGNPSAIGNENQLSGSTEFICWEEVPITAINTDLITAEMGRKGVFVSSQATKVAFTPSDGVTGPVPLLGLSEVLEGGVFPPVAPWPRASFSGLFNSSVPVVPPTTNGVATMLPHFQPNGGPTLP